MKKDVIATPLPPFTEEEEAALSERIAAMDAAALGHYVDSARLSLDNRALDPSWRPRIQMGLERAEAAQASLALLPPEPAEVPAPAAKKTTRRKAVEKTVEA